MKFELRDYQKDIASKAVNVLRRLNIVYLACEVRTGKTLMSLQTAQLFGSKKVLFLTKKKAIKGIKEDYTNFKFTFDLKVINNESAHKFIDDYDLIISDEHHRNGAIRKPNKMTKFIKDNYSHLPMIFLSGTIHPESYSQIYHQFWCSDYTPFEDKSFYKWAKTYINVRERNLGYAVVKDYSDGKKELINPIIKPYIITFTQSDAGFMTEVKENIVKVKMSKLTYDLAKRLKRDKVIQSKDGGVILADTAVKLMQKLHQIYSGTVLFEDKTSRIFDTSKADAIKAKFEGKKIGIFYKFKAEYEALKKVFGDNLTDDLEEFNNTDKNIALQIVSGSEGISLKAADYLVYYNIDFSAKNYWQSRDRLTTMQRKTNDIFWFFSERGIEERIYKQVMNKRNFTVDVFRKDI